MAKEEILNANGDEEEIAIEVSRWSQIIASLALSITRLVALFRGL